MNHNLPPSSPTPERAHSPYRDVLPNGTYQVYPGAAVCPPEDIGLPSGFSDGTQLNVIAMLGIPA